MAIAESITAKVVALAVIVLVITTAALPAITDAQEERVTVGQNTTQAYAASVGGDVTFSFTDDNKLKVNDYLVPAVTHTAIVAISSTFAIVKFTNTNNLNITDSNGSHTVTAASITGGTLTYTASNVEYTQDVGSTFLYASETGTYGEFTPQDGLNFNAKSVLYTFIDNNQINNELDPTSIVTRNIYVGTYDNLNLAFATNTDVLDGKVVFNNLKDENGYISTSNTTTMTFSSDTAAGTYSLTGTKSIFAPIEYTYISSDDDSMRALIGLVAILLILVPVMLAVRMIGSVRS